MSRIGKLPIKLPEGVEVTVQENNNVHLKGPKGEITQKVHPDLSLKHEEGELRVERPTNQKRHRAYHGLFRSLLSNCVTGVSEGFVKKLELQGVGYKATNQGQMLELSVGYSHDIIMQIPDEIKVSTETAKGANPTITLESHDKQLVGQVASKIRSLRKPEPYKGKGIRFTDEEVRFKEGKAGGK